MKKLSLLAFSALFLLIAGCKGGGNLDESTATDVISAHLKANPQYETVRIDVGEVKFKSKNDKADLAKYKGLEEKGLVEMSLEHQKKKFLSKDSVFVYHISLTDKSKPYILKQDDAKATVKALDYVLEDEKPINLIKGDSKVTKVVVSLKKQKNDFAVFLKDKSTTGSFITKTYKLKFKKDSGWLLTGE